MASTASSYASASENDTVQTSPGVAHRHIDDKYISMDKFLLPKENFEKEVHRLHNTFVDWFTCQIDNNESNFNRIEKSMDVSFHIINPQGICTNRQPLLDSLKNAYGCRKGETFEIECKNLQLLYSLYSSSSSSDKDGSTGSGSAVADTTYLVTYEEWHTMGTVKTARITSALFKYDPELPHQLKWVHVHETWMPVKG